MQRIENFLKGVANARKKVGVIYAGNNFETALQCCVDNGFALAELDTQTSGPVIFNDYELVAKIKTGSDSQKIVCIGLEAFAGPRFGDAGFIEQLVKMLSIEEQKFPVVLLLYSRQLFHIFSKVYGSQVANKNQVLDLTLNEVIDYEGA